MKSRHGLFAHLRGVVIGFKACRIDCSFAYLIQEDLSRGLCRYFTQEFLLIFWSILRTTGNE